MVVELFLHPEKTFWPSNFFVEGKHGNLKKKKFKHTHLYWGKKNKNSEKKKINYWLKYAENYHEQTICKWKPKIT